MKRLAVLALAIVMSAASSAEEDPAEITLGERLFLETRFAQAYAANPGQADPVMDTSQTTTIPLAGPFRGKTMNCRACHLVDEHSDNKQAGMRTYADFAMRPPVPARADAARLAPRHSQQLVNIQITDKQQALLHFDGEFVNLTDLVLGTYTGRNYGWLPGEKDQAIKHIASVIRTDDGSDELGKEFGGSYRHMLADDKLPAKYRLDVHKASDSQLLQAVARLVAAYVADLAYSRDDNDAYNGSPYDKFLELNKLPRKPATGESDLDYSRRLRKAVNSLASPVFVSAKHGKFKTHAQDFRFAEQELAGMKIFFAEKANGRGATGNCIACHAAPHFSDYNFHNTGVSQAEYDRLHGAGRFMQLEVPDASTRQQAPQAYLPASHAMPKASGRFRSIPVKDKPALADLGAWNIVLNTAAPKPQATFRALFCTADVECTDDYLLKRSFAAFKTPVIRDLGHSAPYLHNGSAQTLEKVVQHYIDDTARAKSGILRNPATQLQNISISAADIVPLTAFIRALNEDYE